MNTASFFTNFGRLDNASVSKNPELLWKLFPELSKDAKLPPSEVKLLE